MATVFCAGAGGGSPTEWIMELPLPVGTEFETALFGELPHGCRPKLHGVRGKAKVPWSPEEPERGPCGGLGCASFHCPGLPTPEPGPLEPRQGTLGALMEQP